MGISIRNKNQNNNKFKVLVLGEPAVGKTSLIKKFVTHIIEDEYLPTVGAQIYKQVIPLIKGGKRIDSGLLMWDIAGQKRFEKLHRMYYKGAKAIIVVFDLTRHETLKKLRDWFAELQAFFTEEMPLIFLAGNKQDLTEVRQCPTDMIEIFKREFSIQHYYETSALNGENVNKMFTNMAKKLMHWES